MFYRSKRYMWYWVNFVFNRVDRSRVEAVGADRAAAEWILRLGGSVKFKDFEHKNSDYNHLPSGVLHLEFIDATGLAVTNNGLEHLEGLADLHSVVLRKCKYLHDDGLVHLHHVQQTLQHLDLSHCTGLTNKGLLHLTVLRELRSLDVAGIKTTKKTIHQLHYSLPSCKIVT